MIPISELLFDFPRSCMHVIPNAVLWLIAHCCHQDYSGHLNNSGPALREIPGHSASTPPGCNAMAILLSLSSPAALSIQGEDGKSQARDPLFGRTILWPNPDSHKLALHRSSSGVPSDLSSFPALGRLSFSTSTFTAEWRRCAK